MVSATALRSVEPRHAPAERFDDVLEHSPEPLLVTAADHRIRFANCPATQLLEVPARRLVGQPFAPDLAPGAQCDVPRSTASGWKVLEARAIGVSWEGMPARLLALRDVTVQRRDEAARGARATQLERRVEELDAFATTVAHDLREPLLLISGFGQLLQRRHGAELHDAARDYLERIVGSAGHMDRLVSDLLAYARSGGAALEVETVDAAAVACEAAAMLDNAFEEAGATIAIASLPHVAADRAQLQRVFVNLIANALKFRGDRDPHIVISCDDVPDGWCFTVADNGMGIADDDLPHVFQMFRRVHGDPDMRGTGLGLAVCRKIVERHGGHMWATSRLGEGSEFHFVLPDRRHVPRAVPAA
jgi:signal transduction histidine kinase